MLYRALPLSLVALGLALFVGASVIADEAKKVQRGNVHKGTVVSVTADQLVMKDQPKDGAEAKEWTYKLADNAKVMCDGQKCKIEDLKSGQKVRVTTKKGDSQTAVRVESLDKSDKFGSTTVSADAAKRAERGYVHEGTIVSVTADQLVMTGRAKDGAVAQEQTYKPAN